MRHLIKRIPKSALAISLIALINSAVWSFIVPLWQAPDEYEHFAYIQSLVERGKAPSREATPTRHPWSSEQRLVSDESFAHTVVDAVPLKPSWSERDEKRWAMLDRKNPKRDDGGGFTTIASHGPVYYLAQAPVYIAFSNSSILTRIQLMRLLSAFFLFVTVLMTWFLAKEIFKKNNWLPITASILVAFQPMNAFMGGVINNDILTVMLTTVNLFLLVRLLNRGIRFKYCLALSIVTGIGALTKASMLVFLPIIVIAVVFSYFRHRESISQTVNGLLGLLAGFAIMIGVGLLLDSIFGDEGSGTVAIAQPGAPFQLKGFIDYLWQFYLPGSLFSVVQGFGVPGESPAYSLWVVRLWGNFGWLDVRLPEKLYLMITASYFVIGALCFYAFIKYWNKVKRKLPEIIIGLLYIIILTAAIHRAFYPGCPNCMGEQGRYLLPAVPIIAIAIASACMAFGKKYSKVAAVAAASGMVSLNLISQLFVVLRYYT